MTRLPGAMSETAAGRTYRYSVACAHVAAGDRPTLIVYRTDIAFLFFCGWDAHPPGIQVSWPLVFTDDLVRGDPTLENVHTLGIGDGLERRALGAPWRPVRLLG